MLIYGINPVTEALRAGRVESLRISARADERVRGLLRLAEAQGIGVRQVHRTELDRAAHGGQHQGVVADVRGFEGCRLDDLLAGAPGPPLLVVLDGIEEPQNVGAIRRTAAGA